MSTLNEAQLDKILAENKVGDIPVYDQMYLFLRAFQDDEDVDITEAFYLANYFFLYLGGNYAIRKEMNLEEAAEFFDRLGVNKGNAIAMKKVIAQYDFDANMMMSFVEFGLIYYKKTTEALRTNDVDSDPALIADRKRERDEQARLESEIVRVKDAIFAINNPGVETGGLVKGVVTDQENTRFGVRAFKTADLEKELKDLELALVHQKPRVRKAELKISQRKSKLTQTLQDLGLHLYFNQAHYHPKCLKAFPGLERNPLEHGHDVAQFQIQALAKKASAKYGAPAADLSEEQLGNFGISKEFVAWAENRPFSQDVRR